MRATGAAPAASKQAAPADSNDGSSLRSSVRARWCLPVIAAGYFVLAVIAGAPHSPLVTPLPLGAHRPGWTTFLATRVGLRHVARPPLTAVSLLIVAGVLVAFALLVREALAGRVRLWTVLIAAGASLAISVAAPVLLSRDLFSYAAYGRMFALHHHNPYVSVPASFPHDPFVALTATQWRHVHSLYGPVFTLLAGLLARVGSGSPDATILAFKVLAGAAIAAATVLSSIAAGRIRPARAAVAAAMVGLNPVLIIHTVGGGHVDALIAAPLAGALAVAVTGREEERPSWTRAAGVTALLTLACLIKVVVAPALALWLWWVTRTVPPGSRLKTLAFRLAIVVALAAALLSPFLAGGRTLTPLDTLGGVESWASPARFVARGAHGLVGWLGGGAAGTVASKAVVAAFLLMFVALCWKVASGWRAWTSLADGWGTALLLAALSGPYLLPWFVAWFAPFLGLMVDEAMMWIGVIAGGLLALTIIPADPPSGFSAWGVMDFVHYVVAPLMLALLVLAAVRVMRTNVPGSAGRPRPWWTEAVRVRRQR